MVLGGGEPHRSCWFTFQPEDRGFVVDLDDLDCPVFAHLTPSHCISSAIHVTR